MAAANSTANPDREKHKDIESSSKHKARLNNRRIGSLELVSKDGTDDGRDKFI
jgi:UDP-glucose 6-dehydrogenase